jgi:uncharacterized protein
MRLNAIWRHPVKSLQGESPTEAVVEADGLRGDRCWGIRDEASGKILTGRREPRLLLGAASLGEDGDVDVRLPTGATCHGLGPSTDAMLSEWLERPVALVAAHGAPGGKAEYFADATDDSSQAIEWTMPPGRYVDALPILVLTTASLASGARLHPSGEWNVRRFRPNLLIECDAEGWVEDGWCGRTVRVGGVLLTPRQPCVRCTMVTRPQPELERDLDIYRTLTRHHGGNFGVWSTVEEPGTIRLGDRVDIAA